jgi:hypothetical protein
MIWNSNYISLHSIKGTDISNEVSISYRFWHRREYQWPREMRNFALRDKDGNEIGVFTGKQPRQAALKAANRGHTDIRLRERRTKKIHIFTGERVQVNKPEGAPAWMGD